ncbi:MAG TPA: AsmA family protein, partial [Terriglobia bacterium]|nr:AsmA family protein [Terriglobia bacterium]
MKPPIRFSVRKALLLVLVLGLVGWFAPQFFSAERYHSRVQAGLERALDRQVTFGAVTFHLLPRPGFTLENIVISEDSTFGAEPFARVDRMDCDLRLRSLLRWRLEVTRLSLERPSFNLVRNAGGDWNLESLLGRQGPTPLASQAQSVAAHNLHLEMSDARFNFKLGLVKKPFVLDDVSGYLDFDRERHGVSFKLAGSPVRTDMLLPTPGEMRFEGQWMPGAAEPGPLDATLTARGSMLYDWVPILTGRNPEIYGVMDANAHLTGSFRALNAEGQIRLSQLHRWDQPVPSGNLDSDIHFRGQYDREHSRLSFESVDASFADSRLHLTGSVEGVAAQPQLDLVLAIERSHLEDFKALADRFTQRLADWDTSGRVDALMTVQGSWSDRRYGGFVQIRDARLTTPTGAYPVSEIALRIDRDGARLAPVRLDLAPRVSLVAEGTIARQSLPNKRRTKSRPNQPLLPFEYQLNLTAKSVPLRELVRLARGMGVHLADGVDARGEATASFTVSGPLRPKGTPPAIAGRVDLRAARLLIPGLTEPLNVPRAHVQVDGGAITVNPLVAVLGTSVFSGRLDHSGDRLEPWQFDVRANTLRIEQAALWFDALGNRQPVPLLMRLPGLSSLVERRTAASNLFSAINARGRFSTPQLIYRALVIRDFQSDVLIGDRVVRVDGNFHAGGGHGAGNLAVDMAQSPARVDVQATLSDARLQMLAPFLPAALRLSRGSYSASGHVITRGLSRQEISTNLTGEATVNLKNVNFGGFDPLGAMARADGRFLSAPARGEAGLRSATLNFRIKDKRVT